MDTLVLNYAYEPVARVNWQRAITLLWESKVEVIEEYEDWTVRSITIELKVPAVVRFLRTIRGRRKAIKFSRSNIHARDEGRCQYCGERVPLSTFTYDHVIPRAQGGQTTWTNVVVSCTPCNQQKGGRTPEQAGMALQRAPVKPKNLPETIRFSIRLGDNIPNAWRQFLTSYHYWNDALER